MRSHRNDPKRYTLIAISFLTVVSPRALCAQSVSGPPAAPWQPNAPAAQTTPTLPGESLASVTFTAGTANIPIYRQTAGNQWVDGCVTPCTIRVPPGPLVYATDLRGRNSATIVVPVSGASVEVPPPVQVVSDPNATLIRRRRRLWPTANENTTLADAQRRRIAAAPQPHGISGTQVALYIGASLTAASGIVGFIGLTTYIISGYWRSPWATVTIVSGGIFAVGLVTTTIAGIVGYASAGSPIAFAPVVTPTAQGAAMTVRF